MPYVFASFPRPASAAPVALLLLMAAALAGCDDPAAAQEQKAQPKPKVTVVVLKQEPVSIDTILPGRVTAYQVAEVRPQVSGVLRKRLFREGENVTAGRQLYQIDPATYQAALSSAQAQLAKADAAVSSARVTVNRYKPLVAARAVSAIDYDNAVATQKQAEADVALARAAIETAKINLEYTKVLSPISGRTGRSALTVGALVTGDQEASLVTVTQLDPIYVDVTQPSATLLRLRRELDAGRMTRTSGDAAEVKLLLEDGTPYAHAGKLQFSEVTVDPGTGSVTLRAEFPNPDGVLMPGMFVRERIQEGVSPNALLVPQQAITRNYRGDPTTLVLGADGAVQERVVKTDRAIGNKWLVTDGLKAGDKVVVEGLQNVKSGAKPDVTEIGLDELDKRSTPAARPAQS